MSSRAEQTGLDQTALAEPARPLVVVVDDDDAIRDVMRDLLEDAGFDTLGARHGLEGLKLLAALATPPAFILLDLNMPVMDGWAFCDARRKSRTFSEVPVIAISAVEIGESNRPAGVDAVLAKPVDLDDFARLAARMVGRNIPRARPRKALH
jgi:CheY-like chemotaxis protein